MWKLYWRYIASFLLGGIFAVNSVAFFVTGGSQAWLNLIVAAVALVTLYVVMQTN